MTLSSEAMATPLNPWPLPFRMTRQVIDIIPGSAVTDNQLAEAAALFRENYGVWGKQTNRPGKLLQ